MTHVAGPAHDPEGPWGRDTPLVHALGAIDGAGERWSGKLRGRRLPDLGAAVVSNLSDHGAVWVLAAAWMARRPGASRRRAVVALALAGVSSFTVNRAVKRVASRSRPETARPSSDALPVRPPTSSSFPSGHTLASFCTAVALPETASARRAAVLFAAAVAASRVHLRAHHTSDVLGGAVIGAALGGAVRLLVGALAPAGSPE